MSSDPTVMPKGVESIEEAYFQAWGKVGGVGRLRRTFSLYAEIRRMVEFQIQKNHPELGDGEVQRRTAKRMYLSDEAAQRLLDRSRGGPVQGQGLPETMGRITTILEELGLR